MATGERWQAVLLFGMPGSGKGTQGKALGGVPGFLHVATGDIFRNLNQLGPLGREVAAYTSVGKLVPDDMTVQIWRNHMGLLIKQGLFRPADQVVILDGIPRTFAQAELIDRDIHVLTIFNLNLRDEEEAVNRIRTRALKDKRNDDADEGVIRGRLATFQRETAKTLSFYPPTMVQEIDAAQRPIEVLADLANALSVICRKKS